MDSSRKDDAILADWAAQAEARLKRKNQVLFPKDSPFLRELSVLLQGTDHRAAVLWALELAEQSVAELETAYPEETRPREALNAARDWSAGYIKMPLAQRKILDCHGYAKELTSKAHIALCHAVGQACAVVHTAGHALGYPMYELSAIVFRLGIQNCREPVEQRKEAYIDRILFWNAHWQEEKQPWAAFLGKP